MSDPFDRKVHIAEGQKKIFDNKVKYVLFILTVLTAIVVLWDKCPLVSHKAQAAGQVQQPQDTSSKAAKGLSKKEPQVSSKKHHARSSILEATTTMETKPLDGSSTDRNNANTPPASVHNAMAPIKTVESDNIEFKLLGAVGNSGAQTIRMTIVLTTSAANWHIWSAVRSIIDQEGNEYKLKSFTNGASTYDDNIALNTGVPIKLTYTFGGVLPDVKFIKLFKFQYQHKSLDDPIAVEFRGIPIEWR